MARGRLKGIVLTAVLGDITVLIVNENDGVVTLIELLEQGLEREWLGGS